MTDIPLQIGAKARFSKTVSESDVYLFAGITGDFAPNHVDAAAMAKTAFGARIAHGALIVGFMSRASSLVFDGAPAADDGATPVSLGYDRVRFLAPVFFGDTITVSYEITARDEARRRTTAKVEVANQDGALVAVAEHILKWVAPAA
jgi:3-hydroxybutyryl-CoA dehydratase